MILRKGAEENSSLPNTGGATLVFAPLGKDGDVLTRLLREHGYRCTFCDVPARLAKRLEENGSDLILVTEEALTEESVATLRQADAEGRGKQLMVLVLAARSGAGGRARRIQQELDGLYVKVLYRPVRPTQLLETINQMKLEAGLGSAAKEMNGGQISPDSPSTNHMSQLSAALLEGEIRKVTSLMNRAEERERQRLSRLLHDHLQQILVAAKINLELRCDKNSNHAVPDVIDMIDKGIEMTRTLIVDLYSRVDATDDLVALLEEIGASFERAYGLAVELQAPGRLLISDEVIRRLAVQAVRELLFNVVKHAQVDRAKIVVEPLPSKFRIHVRDGGVGFEPAELTTGMLRIRGSGLHDIKTRLRRANGDLVLQSTPGQGATGCIVLPRGLQKSPSHNVFDEQ